MSRDGALAHTGRIPPHPTPMYFPNKKIGDFLVSVSTDGGAHPTLTDHARLADAHRSAIPSTRADREDAAYLFAFGALDTDPSGRQQRLVAAVSYSACPGPRSGCTMNATSWCRELFCRYRSGRDCHLFHHLLRSRGPWVCAPYLVLRVFHQAGPNGIANISGQGGDDAQRPQHELYYHIRGRKSIPYARYFSASKPLDSPTFLWYDPTWYTRARLY